MKTPSASHKTTKQVADRARRDYLKKKSGRNLFDAVA